MKENDKRFKIFRTDFHMEKMRFYRAIRTLDNYCYNLDSGIKERWKDVYNNYYKMMIEIDDFVEILGLSLTDSDGDSR